MTSPLILSATDPHAITLAAQLIQAGELIVFPTDTVYGIGCDPYNRQAVEQLHEAKQRSLDKGIPVLVADLANLERMVAEVPAQALPLIQQFMPGSLTLILPKKPDLPPNLSPNDGIAIRIPGSVITRNLLQMAGGAIATSSANLSGQPAARTAQEARSQLGEKVALILDGGNSPQEMASTIVDCRQPVLRLIRLGPISLADLSPFFSPTHTTVEPRS